MTYSTFLISSYQNIVLFQILLFRQKYLILIEQCLMDDQVHEVFDFYRPLIALFQTLVYKVMRSHSSLKNH